MLMKMVNKGINVFKKESVPNYDEEFLEAISTVKEVHLKYRTRCGGFIDEFYHISHISDAIAHQIHFVIGSKVPFQIDVQQKGFPRLIREIGIWNNIKATISWKNHKGETKTETVNFRLVVERK